MGNYKKKFGKHLQDLRKKRNYTQWKLAEITGIDSKYLSRLESGASSPSFDMLKKLADALEVSPDYIMKGYIDLKFQGKIAEILGKFELKSLEKVEKLLNIAYDLAHYD